MKLSGILLVSLACAASAGKAKLRLPDSFEFVKGETTYDCSKRSEYETGDTSIDGALFEFKKLKKFIGPFDKSPMCFDTFRCRLAGGECLTRRKCKVRGPGYKWRPKMCGKKPWYETMGLVDALQKLGTKVSKPEVPESHEFKLCGCCLPPEEKEEEDENELLTWGCAPADYTACAYGPSDQSGCEAHGDKTGDLVCAWDGKQCVGCTSIANQSDCDVQPNCGWASTDGKCVASSITTSPIADSDGNAC